MKPWIKSKTVWVGIIQLIAALALYLNGYYQDHEGGIPTSPVEITLVINGIAMIVLRWLTDSPITSVVKPLDSLRPQIAKRFSGN